MDLGLNGKRAAVAAASRGLGFGVAQALVAEGVQVAICSRDRANVDDAVARLGGGAGAIGLVADMGEPDSARDFVRAARDALDGLDILVTNAGGPPAGNWAATPFDRYPPALALNLLSVIAMCNEGVPSMRAQRWGRVVAITSISVRQPIPDLILSNTARSGATGFLKTLAREVASDGVTVNSLQPGLHATDRVVELYGGGVDASAMGRPEDFGAVAAFLCSDHARFITGAAIPVDGGAYQGLQ